MQTATSDAGFVNDEVTSQAVVTAVAEETGTDPMDLEPLYNVVDSDALNTLFRSHESVTGGSLLEVQFTYAGCDVRVTSDGSIEATALSE